jgi:tetratricopeptide (TPR) repeat protein
MRRGEQGNLKAEASNLKPATLKATRQESNPQTLQVVCVCAFLALAVLAVFGQTAHFEFVNYDDNDYVYANPMVTSGLTWKGVAWVWSHAQCNFYHPLTMLSLMVDYQFHKLNAGGYHLTNVLIHTASVILLFLILRRMTGALWRSAFVAAVFAIHPLRVESVAWVTERKDVLGAFFFMLTLGAYVRHVRNPNSLGRYLMVALFFVLGLLCKPTALALPFALLLLDYWPLGRMVKGKQTTESGKRKAESAEERSAGVPFWQLVKEKIPLAALAALAGVVTYFAEGTAVMSTAKYPMVLRVGNVLVSYVVYLRQMVWPSGLAAFYPYPTRNYPLWEIGLAFLLLAGVSAGVLSFWRTRPWLAVGWFWYLGMLVPAIGIVQVGDFAHADRNTYLPQIGLYVLLTWAAADMSAGWRYRRLIQGACSTAILVALIYCARAQTSFWRDSGLLWRHTLVCNPGNSVAHNSLGAYYSRQGELEAAITQYKQALEIKPDYAEALNNLGVAFFTQGDLEDAVEQYRKALETLPDDAEIRDNLGNALAKKGELNEAVEQYRKAVQINPDYEIALNNLGHALALAGQEGEAIAQFRKALQIAPGHAEAHFNLGTALAQKGADEEAIAQFQKALEINPDYLDAHYNLGNTLAKHDKVEDAAAQYRKALQINPAYEPARINLGNALRLEGNSKEAVAQYQKVLEINPNQVSVQNNLAWLLATTPDASLRNGTKAVALAAKASQLSGAGNPLILRTLAAAYAEEGSYGLASATARRALELAVEEKNQALAATLQKEIKLYETGAPMRDSAR